MSEPHGSSKTSVLLGIAALGATAGLCGVGGLAGLYLSSRGGGPFSGGNPPPPGNPKGSFYDQPDAGQPDAPVPEVLPLPANPKGSLYDDPGLVPPAPTPPPADEPAAPTPSPHGAGVAGSKP